MWIQLLADTVATVHLLLMIFVVLGQLAILVGIVFRWRWIRNPWFRWIHFATVLTVAIEAVVGVACPLTTWEDDLRDRLKEELKQAGEPTEAKSFTERVVLPLLVPDFHNKTVDLPFFGNVWVLDILYYSFAVLVLLSFILAPPGRQAPAGRLALKLACRAPPGTNGRPRRARAVVLVARPGRGGARESVVCPVCQESVAVQVRSRKRFWAGVGVLALVGAAVAVAGFLLGAPAAGSTRRSVLYDTVMVIGLVLLILAPSGILIRRALLSASEPSASPSPRRHKLSV
jgi:hypothetical protein